MKVIKSAKNATKRVDVMRVLLFSKGVSLTFPFLHFALIDKININETNGEQQVTKC